MACGGRVYKGDTVTISVPFEVDDYSNLTITYTTIGDAKIEKTQDEVEIEDGFITYTFEPGELDLLPDGVIYYTIECEVLGVPNVDSTNTNLYLKTPAGYSGLTADEIYQSGYTEGYNQGQADCPECSGSSCNLQSKSVVISANTQTVSPDQGYDGMDSVSIDAKSFGDGRYQQGYEAGYDSGYEDAEEDYPRIQHQKNYTADTTSFVIVPDTHYDAMGRVNVNATSVFNQGYQSGLTACSGETPCDCSSAITEAYQSGYTAGLNDCSGSTDCSSAITEAYQSGYTEGYDDALYEKCNLTTILVVVPSGSSGMVSNVTPPSGYAGFETVSVNATEYGQEMFDNGFQSGYTAGLADCSGETPCDCTEAYENGYSQGYDAGNAAGYAAGYAAGEEYGFDIGYDEGHQSGYTEGYDDGYLSGASTTDCSSAISQSYNNGRIYGYAEGKDSVIKSLLTENDTDLVIGYYYTSARTNCLITGEYHDSNIDYDGNSAFVSMSVNGGSWQPVEKYLELPAGWSQVRFSGCTTLLLGAFSHRFTPSQECYMDALKIVSLPTKVDGLSNTYTFHMNDGLRVIASSCGIMRGATNGADNINVVITHYTGNQREYNYFPSNGVLFIPEGSSADWTSILSNWTHIEMF